MKGKSLQSGVRDPVEVIRTDPAQALLRAQRVTEQWPELRKLLCPRCRRRGEHITIDPEAAPEGYALCNSCWVDTVEGRA